MPCVRLQHPQLAKMMYIQAMDIYKSPGAGGKTAEGEDVSLPDSIQNIKLRCGSSLIDVSLWRDEALCDLHIGDDVEITHLYSDLLPRGRGNLNTSQYTNVKIAERETTRR